ncbi:MAG: hypothetical protein IH614_04170 [Desulfuromonadales bacterium]|nr:hypothetical protein [Desulfuromonadales bacterium]
MNVTKALLEATDGIDRSSIPEIYSAVDGSEATEIDDVIGTACYLCHGCVNFGVHGKELRPCAQSVSEIINRRRRARNLGKVAHLINT